VENAEHATVELGGGTDRFKARVVVEVKRLCGGERVVLEREIPFQWSDGMESSRSGHEFGRGGGGGGGRRRRKLWLRRVGVLGEVCGGRVGGGLEPKELVVLLVF
jgi:hypothetical protein